MAGLRPFLAAGGADAAELQGLDPAMVERLRARWQNFGPAALLQYDKPVDMARGEGVYLFDAAGYRYLDLYNNVPSVGHGHPQVVSAIAAQAATLNTHSRHLNDGGRLCGAVAGAVSRAAGQSGDDLLRQRGQDFALRIAGAVTGRKGVIVTSAARHGTTAATAEISPALLPEPLPPHVRTIPAPDPPWPAAAAYHLVRRTAVRGGRDSGRDRCRAGVADPGQRVRLRRHIHRPAGISGRSGGRAPRGRRAVHRR